jgi:uncharacterized protein DUF3865
MTRVKDRNGLSSLFDSLRRELRSRPGMAIDTNAVTHSLNALSLDGLLHVVRNYARFPAEIVRILETGRTALSMWPDVADELSRNIDEESGPANCSGSHFEIFRTGIIREYGFDIRDATVHHATRAFIDTIIGLVSSADEGFAAGAVYAIEASAVPEIEVLRAVLDNLSNRLNGRGLITGSPLDQFVVLHLEHFEPEHEEGLRRVLRHHLAVPGVASTFTTGFCRTLDAMDSWWIGLGHEAAVRS